MALCRITGTVQLPDGSNAANRTITFKRNPESVVAQSGVGIIPDNRTVRVDRNGNVDFELYTGNYLGVVDLQRNDGRVVFAFPVPDAATANFQDILQAVDHVAPLPSWLDEAFEARDASVGAADIAADAAERAEAFGWRNKNSVADLISDTTMTTANTPVGSGVHVNGVGDYVRVAGTGDLSNAAGLQFDVKPDADGFINVSAFGSDVASWQLAFDKYESLSFKSGVTYGFTSAILVSKSTKIKAIGANLVGSGVSSLKDIFQVTNESAQVYIDGGNYSACRWAIAAEKANVISVSGAIFKDMACAIGANAIANTPFATGKLLHVDNCDFEDMEVGILSNSCIFKDFIVMNNTGRNFHDKGLTTRAYPLDKKITAGVWISTLTINGACNFIIEGNSFDGIQEITPATSEPEVHGIAVHALDNQDTNAIISGNVVKNVTGVSTLEGLEGIMGRANRVIISDNILLNAGNLEGAIYAKASAYNKVTNNIVQVTSDYIHGSTARGVIADGDANKIDVSGNKFIGLNAAIYTRSTYGKYSGNEFFGCGDCIVLALIAGYTHNVTIIEANFADENCVHFFRDATSTAMIKGDFILSNNTSYGSGYFCGNKGAVNLVVSGNKIKRRPSGTTRELILCGQEVTRLVLKDNTILAFETSLSDGRVFSNSGGYVKSLHITNNHIRTGNFALVTNNGVYVDYIIRNNDFLDCNAIQQNSITVSGKNVVTANVGIDL